MKIYEVFRQVKQYLEIVKIRHDACLPKTGKSPKNGKNILSLIINY